MISTYVQREVWEYRGAITGAKLAIAAIYEKQNKRKQAQKAYEQVAKASENPLVAWRAQLALAELYKRQNRTDESLEICERVLGKMTTHGKGLRHPPYARRRRVSFGRQMARPAIPMMVTETSVRLTIAGINEDRKEYEEAMQHYRKALEKEPEGEQALLVLYLMAKAYEKQKKLDEAAQTLQRIIQMEETRIAQMKKEFDERFIGRERPPLPRSMLLHIARHEMQKLSEKR